MYHLILLLVGTRLRHLIDKFCENCVNKLIAPYLHRTKICNICQNFSQPVNDKPELSGDWGYQLHCSSSSCYMYNITRLGLVFLICGISLISPPITISNVSCFVFLSLVCEDINYHKYCILILGEKD